MPDVNEKVLTTRLREVCAATPASTTHRAKVRQRQMTPRGMAP
ncbi:hypothetical protein [Actinokineospora enzanensis]